MASGRRGTGELPVSAADLEHSCARQAKAPRSTEFSEQSTGLSSGAVAFLELLPAPARAGSLRPTFSCSETVRWPVATVARATSAAPAVSLRRAVAAAPFPPAAAMASAPASDSCS